VSYARRSRTAATCLAVLVDLRQRRNAARVVDVAAAVTMSKASAARQLAMLELYGLAVCEPDPAHKQRQVWRAA
jgi:DNA-binding IclR family transcriptional regulator